MEKKDNVYTPISIDDAMKKLAEERDKILEAFAKAYLAETGLLPSQVELVTERDSVGMTIKDVYYFRRKE